MTRCRRITREVKYVKELTPSHIKETKRKYSRGSNDIEIIIPGCEHTKVSKRTREIAKKNRVRIRRFWGFR